jgi:hypothetical protein
MASNLSRYAKHGQRRVEGWLLSGAIELVMELAAFQRERGVKGPACEIGVHHGRLFILLHLLALPERALGIDLFELQSENVDQSGEGSRDALNRNLRRHGCDLSRVELLTENSLRLTPERIVELCGGRPRLFSVDGGHTAEITANDLALADRSVCDGGLVILDDYFNSSWPAVSEGACRFMSEGGRLHPVAIGANKFLFAKGDAAAAAYREHVVASHPGASRSTVFAQPVICLGDGGPRTLRSRITTSPQWLRIRQTPVGRALLRLKGKRT